MSYSNRFNYLESNIEIVVKLRMSIYFLLLVGAYFLGPILFLNSTSKLTLVYMKPPRFATSYGEVNKEYHEAYSRQIISQIRTECESDDENEPSDHAKWF